MCTCTGICNIPVAGMNVYDDLIHGLSICEMAYLFVDSYSGLMDVLLISLF